MKFSYSKLTLMMLMIMAGYTNGQTVSTSDENIALGGYDVVTYHTAYEAVRGNNSHRASHEGVTYYFNSEVNRELFEKNPEAYLPAYGGFCAFAMAMQGKAVPSDPQTFKIRDGRLFLFYNDYYEGKPFNTIVPWNAQEKELVSKADAHWKSMN